MEKNKPVRTLWHGNVKASIWENPTQNGIIHSVNYARIYTDKQGKIREAYTFSDVENLRLAALASQAGDILNTLKQEYNARSRSQSQQAPVQQKMQVTQGPPQTYAAQPEQAEAQNYQHTPVGS